MISSRTFYRWNSMRHSILGQDQFRRDWKTHSFGLRAM